MSNKKEGTLYIGVTSNLVKRVYEHKNSFVEGFTSKYYLKKLVYFELHETMEEAIKREKQLKKWNRQWKIELIEDKNIHWNDLYSSIL
jgi:putative endonuclease